MSSLDLADAAEFRASLERIRNENDPTDWVLLSYKDKKIAIAAFGDGGLKAFSSQLKDDEVHFGVLSFLVEVDGDDYKTAKNILITWLGPNLPGGLVKARAAAHRKQLRDFIQETVTVACEMQASTLEELNEEMVGQAISRTRGGLYATARSVGALKQPSGKGSGLGGASARLQMADQVAADAALKYVVDNKNSWAIFAYSKGKKDELEHVESGLGGLETLVAHWPPSDRVYFCYCSILKQNQIWGNLSRVGGNVLLIFDDNLLKLHNNFRDFQLLLVIWLKFSMVRTDCFDIINKFLSLTARSCSSHRANFIPNKCDQNIFDLFHTSIRAIQNRAITKINPI